jgi:nicotinamide riboside kinase
VTPRDLVDLYLLADINVPFVQDGWRDGEMIREQMHQQFLTQLQQSGRSFEILSGNWQERQATAIAAINRLLATLRRF